MRERLRATFLWQNTSIGWRQDFDVMQFTQMELAN